MNAPASGPDPPPYAAAPRPFPPLARAAALLAAGILIGLRTSAPAGAAAAPAGLAMGWADLAMAPTGLALALAGAAMALAALAMLRPRRGPALALLLMLAGVAAGASAAAVVGRDCRARLPDGARLRLRGAFAAEPVADASAELLVEQAWLRGRALECRGRLRVRLPEAGGRGAGGGLPRAGRDVVVSGRWRTFPPASRWPRPAARAGMLLMDGLREADTPRDGHGHPLLDARGAAQRRVRALFGGRAAVVEALVLARKEGLDPAVRDRFARAGLAHLLAISGLHVGVVAGALLLVGRLLRLGPGRAALAAGVATSLYVVFLGAPFAACRAALQLLLLLAAYRLQRPSDPFALMAAAAVLLLLLDPLALLDAGFQLSFAGAAGLILLRRPILGLLPARVPRWCGDSLAASVAATATTGPIAALHFGQAAPGGIVANLAAIPLVGFAVPAIALTLLADALWAPAGHALGGGAALAVAALDRVAGEAAAAPLGHFGVTGDVALAWLLATLLAVALARWRGGPLAALRTGTRALAHAGLAAVVFVGWPAATDAARGGALEIHAIDVGQGDALAIRTPRGRWILVDAGPRSPTWDAGEARVVPFLLEEGAGALALLVLTHPDADHVGGAAAVLGALRVAAVLEPGVAVGKAPYLDALRVADRHGTRWYRAAAGVTVRIDDVEIRALAPRADDVDAAADANEFSVVFRIVYGDFAALFTGDASTEVEERLVAGSAAIRGQVLKVGHHGSATSTSQLLLDAVRPVVALISVGRSNRYGHPDRRVLRRLEDAGIRVFRTDEDGAVRVRAWRDGRVDVTTSR